jgi:hypothetical protein
MSICEVCGKNSFDDNFLKCKNTSHPLYWRHIKDDNKVIYFCNAQHSHYWMQNWMQKIKEKDANTLDYKPHQ